VSNDAAKGVKEIVRIVARLEGWSVEHGRHIKFRFEGRVMAIAPTSPSDKRTVKNLRADLKRKGCPL
jgi:hypothetical protein